MSQDMFWEDDIGGSPVESSGVSGGFSSSNSDLSQPTGSEPATQPSEPVIEFEPVQLPEGPPYACPYLHCKKVYKTQGWYRNHQAAHKINDADKHAPSKEMFSAVVRRIMTLIISEMKQEPYYDTPESKNKVIFLEELSSKSESLEWGKFVAELSDPLLSIISKKSKLLPLNQYEEAQRKLNLHLRNGQNLARLKDLLCKVCVTELLPRVAGRIVFRIATKLMDEIQLFVAKELRASRATGRPHSAQPEEVQEMSEAEEKSFAEMLGYLFRESLKRDKRCNSRQKQAQSLCLKETFICAQNPPSFEQFLNKENWLSGDENSIVPSENAINFFQIVEQCVKSERSIHKLNTLDKVINSLLHSIEALELWFHLTDARLSEECALFFMREIVTTFVNKSIHLEDSRKNRLEEKNRQESQAALRTHLLRNYKSTDAEDVDCPSAS